MKIRQLERPKIKPYAFSVVAPWRSRDERQFIKVVEWIILNIGSIDDGTWDLRADLRGLGTNEIKVYFDDEKDSMAFKLRWM